MKRIWFAVIFLALAAGICFAEQHYIDGFYRETDKRISAAMVAADTGNIPLLDGNLRALKDYWNSRNEVLCMLSNHAALDELGACIRAANATNENITEELERIGALNEVFYENQHITFANIF